MSYKQLITPNLQTTGKSGYCLKFTGDSYSLKPRPYDSAKEAWDNAKYKHTDALPTDVAVPVFFTWSGYVDGVYGDYGDVAIWVPGKGVFGSPIKTDKGGNRWDKTVQDRAKVIGGGAKYIGWTEDLNTVRLVEEESMDKITRDQENTMSFLATGDYPGKGYDYRWTGQPATESILNQFINFWLEQSRNVGLTKEVSDLEKQLSAKPGAGTVLKPGTYLVK